MRNSFTQNSNLPELKSVSQLDIKNLKKIKISRDKYLIKQEKYLVELRLVSEKNKQINALNSRNQVEFERWVEEVNLKKINPNNERIRQIRSKVKEREVGLLSGLWRETVEVMGIKIAAEDAANLRETQVEFQRLSFELERYQEKKKNILNKLNGKNVTTEKVPQPLKDTTTLVINGVRMRINFKDEIFNDLDIILNQKISQFDQLKETEIERLNQLKARASKREEEVRSQMQKYRGDFSKQIKLLKECPYCGKPLSKSTAHMDHIYPVAKGGQSVRSNLVFVCSNCNQKKGMMTLNNFISRHRYDQGLVYSRLKKLDKDF